MDPRAASDSLYGAARRASEVLPPPCRLNILTARGSETARDSANLF